MSKAKWEIKKLGEVCDVISGQSPESRYYNNNEIGLPFYQGKKEFSDKFIGEPTTWTSKITKEAYMGDILMSVRAPVGPVNFATKKICIGRGLAAIRAGEKINREFLFNFLLKHQNEIESTAAAGAVFSSINQKQIQDIKLPIPPLPEQQRIVTLLDQAFEAIDQAKANAEKNLQNAKELFESYLQSIFENKGDGWEEKKLGEVCEVISGQSPQGQFYNKEGKGIPFYQGKKDFGDKYLNKPTTWTTQTTKEAIKDDILMSVRAPVGPINFAAEKICIGRGLAAIRASKILNKQYLFYFLLKHEKEIENSAAEGAVFSSINREQIKNINISVAPLSEQQHIVTYLDNLQAQTQKLEANYQAKLEALEELRKSILEKAFNGKL